MKKKLRNLVAVWVCLLLVCGIFQLNVYAEETEKTVQEQVEGKLHEGKTREVLKLVNEERAKAGLAPLEMTEAQEDMAEQRAAEITAVFEHKRPDGRDCFSIAGDMKWSAIGENIAAGQTTAQEVMDTWMKSEGHKANILNGKFTHIGIGCFEYEDRLYWVQFFTGEPSETTLAKAEGKDDIEESFSYLIICKHEETYLNKEIKEPTCTEAGYEKVVCSRCGKEISSQTLEATGHNFTGGEEKIIQAATCETEGEKEITCVNEGCNATTIETIPVTEHSFGEWVVTKEATCIETGVEQRKCSVCGLEETRELAATGHNFTGGEEKIIQAATCVKEGTKEIACVNEGCDATTIETIPMTEHSFGEWVVTKEAAWNTEGRKERVCANCGEKETEVLPKLSETHVHDFNTTGIITREATCTEAGEIKYACVNENCSAAKIEAIPAKGHSFGEWKVTKPATWKTEGLQERICTECGEKESDVLPVLSANHEHVYNGTETIVKPATCTEEGIKTIACGTAECDAKMTVSIQPTGHYEGKWETVREATCTQVGKSVQRCSRCDAVIAEKAIAMKAHNYGEWEVVKKATASAEGEKKRVCKDCGYTEKASVKKLAADTEKQTVKTSTDTKKNTSKNNVKTGDDMRPLYYVIGLAGAGAIISLILYRIMRRKER